VYLKDYPVDAVEFMRANEIEGNILPWFDWAQLCIRELGIRSKVFFDGRYGIAYSEDFIKKYFALINYEIDYRDYLLRFPETDIMFLSITNPLTLFLYRDKEWVAVYVSPEAVIFLKRNLKNHPVIEKHKSGKLIYHGIIEPYYFK